MNTAPENLQVWLHSLCSSVSLPLEAVATCLHQVQIMTSEFHPNQAQKLGIIILSDVTPDVYEFVDAVSRNGAQRILVLAANEIELAEDNAWRLLQAGASDILMWDHLSDAGQIIRARFERWRQVDALVEMPLVRNHLVGRGRAWKSIVRRLVEVAYFTDSPILLTGETGTGKELVAQLIHTLDRERQKSELVIVDCTTIVSELSGSELFGHERGAFTGAIAARDGAFALADGGTLFLDEVGELPLRLQTQLLRVLQEQTYKRVGSNTWRHTDFRLICATNRDLLLEEARGRFRRDLYYRIAAWTIKLPPLRERVEDIIPLVRHFIRQVYREEDLPDLDQRVQAYFLSREYPGNVRDLKNLVERIMARYVGYGPITMGNIPADDRPAIESGQKNWSNLQVEQAVRQALALGAGLREIKRTVEETAIQIAISDAQGNLQRAAKQLGITDRTLQKRKAEQKQQIRSMMNGSINS